MLRVLSNRGEAEDEALAGVLRALAKLSKEETAVTVLARHGALASARSLLTAWPADGTAHMARDFADTIRRIVEHLLQQPAHQAIAHQAASGATHEGPQGLGPEGRRSGTSGAGT